jgi:hypothetical protein
MLYNVVSSLLNSQRSKRANFQMNIRFLVSLDISSLKYLTVFQSSFQRQQQEFVFEGHLNESFSLKSKKSSNLIERKERRECVSCLSVHTCVKAFLSS